jgi:hypothetical protein
LERATENLKEIEKYVKKNKIEEETAEKLRRAALDEGVIVITSPEGKIYAVARSGAMDESGTNVLMGLPGIEMTDVRYLNAERAGTAEEAYAYKIATASEAVNDLVGKYSGYGLSAALSDFSTDFDNSVVAMQAGLDLGGMIPGIGIAFDAGSGVISRIRGDEEGVFLSALALDPAFVGTAAGMTKLTKNSAKTAKSAEKLVETITKEGGSIAKAAIKLAYKPTSGIKLVADPNKTTTVLGSYRTDMKSIVEELGNVKTANLDGNKGGFNVLNVPDTIVDNTTNKEFWNFYNRPFIDKAIERGDNIVLATKPTNDVLYKFNKNTGKKELTGFGKEFFYLTEIKGYVYNEKTMKMIKK